MAEFTLLLSCKYFEKSPLSLILKASFNRLKGRNVSSTYMFSFFVLLSLAIYAKKREIFLEVQLDYSTLRNITVYKDRFQVFYVLWSMPTVKAAISGFAVLYQQIFVKGGK
ncbi:hypothetical protein ILYODFUR_009253 [Ilyodon furcidens]|uniref:Uncharacterized protein n=1 Tax=Ilyodon furcidens TaxID=33524 RepID=A0ABV0U5R5_9TELE